MHMYSLSLHVMWMWKGQTDHYKGKDHPHDEEVEPHHGARDHVGGRPRPLIEELRRQNASHSS